MLLIKSRLIIPPSGYAQCHLVHRLRRKLAAASIRIVTLRGFGYILKDAADVA